MAVTLSAVANTLLPPTITGPIFSKALEESAIMQLARRVPLSVNANTAIPISMDVPVADWVAEGGIKPASQVGTGVKVMTGKKVAVLVPVSEEIVNTNPAGLYDLMLQDLPTAIARAFDYAAINGKSLRTGAAGPFVDSLSNATNSVALGTTTVANGGLYVDLLTGVGKVIDKNFDFTGFAADPRMKVDAQMAVDSQGLPLLAGGFARATNQAAMGPDSLVGYDAYFNKGVSGKYWRAGDSVQVVTIVGTPTGGTFALSSGGNTASALAFNAAAATVQTAVQAFGGIYATVTVAGAAGGPYTITFPAIASNLASAAAPFSASQLLLTGGTAAASKATIVASGAGGTDSLLRAVGGDFGQCAYGIGMDINVRISTEASFWDGTTWTSAFQSNLVLLLVEAYFGFVVGSNDAFTLYTKGTAAF